MYLKKKKNTNDTPLHLSCTPAHTQRNLLQEAPTGQIKQNFGINIKDSDGFRCIE